MCCVSVCCAMFSLCKNSVQKAKLRNANLQIPAPTPTPRSVEIAMTANVFSFFAFFVESGNLNAGQMGWGVLREIGERTITPRLIFFHLMKRLRKTSPGVLESSACSPDTPQPIILGQSGFQPGRADNDYSSKLLGYKRCFIPLHQCQFDDVQRKAGFAIV